MKLERNICWTVWKDYAIQRVENPFVSVAGAVAEVNLFGLPYQNKNASTAFTTAFYRERFSKFSMHCRSRRRAKDAENWDHIPGKLHEFEIIQVFTRTATLHRLHLFQTPGNTSVYPEIESCCGALRVRLPEYSIKTAKYQVYRHHGSVQEKLRLSKNPRNRKSIMDSTRGDDRSLPW